MSQYKIHRVRFIDYTPKSINSSAFNSKSQKVAFSRDDGSIEIRNPLTNMTIDYVIPGKDGRSVEHIEWCGDRLFSGGLSGDLIEWNMQKLVPEYHQDSYGGAVWCIKFNHALNMLAAGCEDGSIRLFQVTDDGIEYLRALNIQESRILSLSWDYSDEMIVSGGFDCSMRLYDVNSGRIFSRMTTDMIKGQRTLVWSVEFLKDQTIVMGDSLGNTQFWNGSTQTLMKSFNSHCADVLAIAISEDEQTVYSAGIDSKVARFVLSLIDGNWEWVLIDSVRATDYDTRTLVYCKTEQPFLISGGIDPRFVVYPIDSFNTQSFMRYSCLPSSNCCHLAYNKNIIMSTDEHQVNAWILGDTTNKEAKPKKLLEIKVKGSDHLICADISVNAKYIAYSTIAKANIVELSNHNEGVTIKKLSTTLPASTHIKFLSDEKQLVSLSPETGLNVVNIESGTCTQVNFANHMKPTLPLTQLHLSKDGKYACIIDTKQSIFIFSLEREEFVTKLPNFNSNITECNFHPTNNNLFIVTSLKELYEYDIDQEKLLPWASDVTKKGFLKKLGRESHNINNLVFNPSLPDEIFLQAKENFGKLIYNCGIQNTVEEGVKKKKRKLLNDSLKVNRDYTNIMYLDITSGGEIVIVERLINSILEKLPEALKLKKFGV